MKKLNYSTDFCVVGGGLSGLCAALAAARHGIKTVLIQDRPMLGGNASSEVRMWVCGAHGKDNRETGIIEELVLENFYFNPGKKFTLWDSVLYGKAVNQENLTLLLNSSVLDADCPDGVIKSVTAWQSNAETFHTVTAEYFADCSGDSILAPLTGALYRYGREAKSEFGETIPPDTADKKTMGMSCLFQIRETDKKVEFIPPEWAYTYETDADLPYKDPEPDIYNAIKRNALLENVTLDAEGKIDFADKSVTENTRVSYPIDHIQNIVRPISSAPAAKNVIFLSADAFGVLPPVSILTPEQTQYYFLSGFTAKLAGTERGITEPTPTFSACFGQAFLELHPTKYAEELVKKMQKSGAKAYLVNTGWNGTGKRISIKDTRGIIDAILSGAINEAPTKKIPHFDFEVPTELPGVDSGILDPRDTYADASEWEKKAQDLASRFVKNFVKYEGNEAGKALVAAGPKA